MQIFGLEISRRKAAPLPTLSSADANRGWYPLIREAFGGAWQRGLVETRPENLLTFAAVYACVTLIASDIAKLRPRLMAKGANNIWTEPDNPAYSPVLRKPNHYQTRIQFYEHWLASKLIHGNTYALKQRDQRGIVTALYVLDPTRVRVLVAPNGDVYYQLSRDDLSRQAEGGPIVPASEIIHDIMVALYHPLCGVSPITACGLAATQGLRVQEHSSNFFANGAQPGGILSSPGILQPEQAKLIQSQWEEHYGGQNAGRVAVLGGDLKYQPLTMMNATDAQLIEQLKWTAENVCTTYHVPPYMIGVGPPPTYTNIEALSVQYYTQCLQTKIESIEVLLDEGLGLSLILGTEFDLDGLMRMDTQTRSTVSKEAVGSGSMSPNESRARFWNLPPVAGGESPYLQEQNFSLAALAKRDAQADPFANVNAKKTPAPAALPPPDDARERAAMRAAFRKNVVLA